MPTDWRSTPPTTMEREALGTLPWQYTDLRGTWRLVAVREDVSAIHEDGGRWAPLDGVPWPTFTGTDELRNTAQRYNEAARRLTWQGCAGEAAAFLERARRLEARADGQPAPEVVPLDGLGASEQALVRGFAGRLHGEEREGGDYGVGWDAAHALLGGVE